MNERILELAKTAGLKFPSGSIGNVQGCECRVDQTGDLRSG